MAAFIMARQLQAIGFVVFFAFIGLFLPLIGLLSSAAIGLVTLRLGWRVGLQTLSAAAVILGVTSALISTSLTLALVATLAQWLLVLLLASILQLSSSWKQVLTTVFVLAVTGTVLFHLIVSDTEAFWIALMQPLTEILVMQQQFKDQNLEQAIAVAAGFATGMTAAFLSVGLILSLMIARHWQAALYNPGGFKQEARELSVARSAGLFMVVLISIGLFTNFPLIVNAVIAGLAMFLFQGIALVNDMHHKRSMHKGWLIGFYVLLAFMPIRLGFLLATFGIIDSIVDFRKHIKKQQ